MNDWLKKAIQEVGNDLKPLQKILNEQKENTTMQVTYNGFIGDLVKLERHNALNSMGIAPITVYDLSIYDSEKQVTHSFAGVKLEDVKFLGGAVAFGG